MVSKLPDRAAALYQLRNGAGNRRMPRLAV
jgi:hypothetical protein